MRRHGASAVLYIPPEFYDYSHEHPTPEVLESIWDGQMRIWSRPLTYDAGKVELKWQDIREHFDEAIENGRKARYCPTRDEFGDMKLVLQQEVCRAYAQRSGNPRTARSFPGRSESAGKRRIHSAGTQASATAESSVLEIIAKSKSPITCPQIMARLKEGPRCSARAP